MPYIKKISVGGTQYDIQADSLSDQTTIDGVEYDGSANIMHYGVSSSAADTIAKTVSIANFALAAGARVSVKFTYANTADNPQLNVSSTGAKPIMVYGTTAAQSGAWNAGEIVSLEYDGTNYIIKGVTDGAFEREVAQINEDMQGYLPLDGYSEDATVGNAEQLVSTVLVNDQTPYIFRTSGASIDIGDREYDTVVGGTIAWNQLVDANTTSVTVPSGRNYIACVSGAWSFGLSDGSALTVNGGNGDMVFDITLMLGRNIAAYISTLETSNPGTGIAWFRKLFPRTGYPYNAGQLLSVNTSAHNMVGFNAFNVSTGTAKLIGGMQYQINGTYTSVSYTDINGDSETITPDDDGMFIPTNTGTLTVTGGDSSTTCVHLVWDGERNGEWEAYDENNYALDSSLTLLGIPRLDANDKLNYNGDTYAPTGTVVRNYHMISLGGFNWTKTTFDGGFVYSALFSSTNTGGYTRKYGSNATGVEGRCSAYPFWGNDYNNNFESGKMPDKYVGFGRGSSMVYIRDESYSTADDFKTAMANVYLVYPLSSPRNESADSFQSPQVVDDWGTEEYVDYAFAQGTRNMEVPVGHNTNYNNNLRAKLEAAPEAPSSGDGDYIVRQTNGNNAYVPMTKELPTFPTQDGSYTLGVTVTDGEGTLAWVSAT